jgi:hypothetical protein
MQAGGAQSVGKCWRPSEFRSTGKLKPHVISHGRVARDDPQLATSGPRKQHLPAPIVGALLPLEQPL